MDYGIYSFLTLRTSGLDSMTSILISNLGARIVSASVNYTINRKLVFQSNVHIVRSVGQYALLATGILACNTIVLSILADYLSIDRYVAKLITELMFFWFSWLVQRKIIFWNEKTPNARSGMLKKKR